MTVERGTLPGSYETRTPVALIMFRRPDLTRAVFQRIAAARPPKLFIFADGPASHRPGEEEKCAATRAVVENVDWDCDVVREYAESNMGPWRRIASGITSAFEAVEELVVLEDDCLPDPTFFRYCDELLERYRHDERVMHIAGNHLHPESPRPIPYSYSFAWHNVAWGYATWRRAWGHFDLGVPDWAELRETDFIERIVEHPGAADFYRRIFDELHANPGEFDGYDWAWSFACWSQRGLSILPETTMIRNIGFGPDSTHFQNSNDPRASHECGPIVFPLRHPPHLLRDAAADDFIIQSFCAPKEVPLSKRFRRRLRRSIASALPASVRSVGRKALSGAQAVLTRSRGEGVTR